MQDIKEANKTVIIMKVHNSCMPHLNKYIKRDKGFLALIEAPSIENSLLRRCFMI